MRSIFAAITGASVRFRIVTIVITVAFLALGVFAASKLNQELLPSVEFPQTFIFILQPGTNSEDLRDLVTIPLEKEVVTINGVIADGLQSTTTAPVAFLTVVNEYGQNTDLMHKKIQAAVDKVVAAGVPMGLQTTADLTPDIVRKVLTQAPSMWKHFEAAQLLAMSPEVLDAALSVNPTFADSLDPLTRDQLAAARLDSAINGTKTAVKPVALPNAWIMTADKLPQLKSFDFSSLPVITASVSSDDPTMTPDKLRALVDQQIVDALKNQHKVANVADVSISGGQQVPADVYQAAQSAVARQNAAKANPSDTGTSPAAPAASPANPPANAANGGTTPAQNNPPAPSQLDPKGVPYLPDSWRSPITAFILNPLLHVTVNTAADLLNTKDATGSKQSAVQAINLLAGGANANLVRDLSPAVLNYLKTNEPGFVDNLSAKALNALSDESYVALKGGSPAPVLSSAWAQLAAQPGFKAAQLSTVRDLLALPNGAAAALNAIVAKTPGTLQSFAIRAVSSLTPDAIAYLNTRESGFLSKLDPQVLRYLSADAIKALPADFVSGLKDDKLKTDLAAIAADPSKAAVASLKDNNTANVVPDDPTAPLLPDSWTTQLKPFGVTVKKADDLLRHPFNQPTAAAFINLLAVRGGTGFMGPLSADVLIYLQAHEPTFYAGLDPATLGYLPAATLAKLPQSVALRAETGVSFTPTKTVTRSNGAESLTISVYKNGPANTVLVADGVMAWFDQVKAANPHVTINTVFEQASFIKDSISGVAREGVLGAAMAVLVILLFLNFSFRSTLVTAVSIPTSIAIAFVLMYVLPRAVHPLIVQLGASGALPDSIIIFLGRLFPESITLNIMTLSGLTVAIGRVVDDSIVVLENIYGQIQRGVKPAEAVLRGTRDVSLAIFAATVTTVVVFLPIGLSGGLIGEIFLPFGLAVTYSLLASFVVAITVVPMLAYLMIREKDVPKHDKEGRLEHAYRGAVEWALAHRWPVLGLAALTLVLGVYLFATRPTTFIPGFGQPQITVAVSMPNGTSLAQTDVRVAQLEDYLKTLIHKDGIARYQTVIGSGGGLSSFVGGGVSGNAAQITIAPDTQTVETVTALTADIRAKAETIFGAKENVKVSKGTLTDSGFGGFALVISGPADKLKALDPSVIKTLSGVPGLANVSSTLSQISAATSTTYLRIAQIAAVSYSAELETTDTLGTTSKAIAAVKAMNGLPADLTVGEGFQSQQQTQGFAQTFGSLGLAILIVYAVMVLTFGSLIHPFTILFSLPLAIVGAALALTLTNRVLGISALIGLLMLVGIVVTNAIVLLDRVQANRKERNMPVNEALVEAGRTRLRPILMTAIATMIALLPLASGLSEGAIIASELGTVVIGGLFSSTILTLLVVPVVYSLLNQAQGLILRRPQIAAPKPVSGD